jgi:dGTP triphosphohydrolase
VGEAVLPGRATDLVAGMTDRFAIRRYEQLNVPRGWDL